MNDLPTYSKTLDTGDYALLQPEYGFLRYLRGVLSGCVDVPHEHRLWEYALALRVLLRSGHGKALDVGGGCGLFSAAATCCGAAVTHVDPGGVLAAVREQAARVGRPIEAHALDGMAWDRPSPFIACLSVIEHVEDDAAFFRHLLELLPRNGTLVLTTDFHPSGERQVGGHCRTYTAGKLWDMARMVESDFGVGFLNGEGDWSHFSPDVYGYSFASLVLRRYL